MKVDRHREPLGGRQDRPHGRVVEERPARLTVDHRPDVAEVAHGPLEFVGRLSGRAHRQRGEGGKPLRMGGDDLGQAIVDRLRQRHRTLGLERLDEVSEREREDLHVNSGFVHHREPPGAAIIELIRAPTAARAKVDPRRRHEVAREHVLFDRDDPHPDVSRRSRYCRMSASLVAR